MNNNSLMQQMLMLNMQMMAQMMQNQPTQQPTQQPTRQTTQQTTQNNNPISGQMTIQDFIALQQLMNGKTMTQQSGNVNALEGIAAQIINPQLPPAGQEANGGKFTDGKRYDIYTGSYGAN